MVKMNSCQVVLPCFFVVIVFNVIQFGTAADKYDPVYFIETENDYELIYNVEKEATKEHYVVKAPNKNILVACPSRDTDSNLIEIRETEINQAIVVPLCEKPNEPSVLNIKSVDDDGEEFMVIGYTIQDPSSNVLEEMSQQTTHNLAKMTLEEISEHSPGKSIYDPSLEKSPEKIPVEQPETSRANQLRPSKYYNIVDLMIFKYDDVNHRIKFVWHNIGAGKLLTPEIGPKSDKPYQTNENIYGYDVNPLYYNSATYVKVQLAPEEDFLFDHMKFGSRQNILTAPMRRDLLPQWQELEIFIRKVAQIIDAVFVMTGIHGTLMQASDEESVQETVYLHDKTYPIPHLFWKSVAVDFTHNGTLYRNGIVFVLHNIKPSSDSVPQKICHDDLSKTEWRFPSDNKFKNLMYACLWSKENMKALGEDKYLVDHEVFDLNRVPTIRIDETGKEIFEEINVIQRIEGTLYTTMRYFVNAFKFPFEYISSHYLSHYYNKNK